MFKENDLGEVAAASQFSGERKYWLKKLSGGLRKNIGIPDDDNIYFMHATKSKNTEGKPIGVNIASQETYLDSLIYDSDKPRLLSHYCRGVDWWGVVILRRPSTF
jgi:hypothetical protein